MIIKTMYRYEREPGKITVSFTQPTDKPFTEVYRLIANDNKVITNDGVNICECIDVDSYDGYYEIEKVETEGLENE